MRLNLRYIVTRILIGAGIILLVSSVKSCDVYALDQTDLTMPSQILTSAGTSSSDPSQNQSNWSTSNCSSQTCNISLNGSWNYYNVYLSNIPLQKGYNYTIRLYINENYFDELYGYWFGGGSNFSNFHSLTSEEYTKNSYRLYSHSNEITWFNAVVWEFSFDVDDVPQKGYELSLLFKKGSAQVNGLYGYELINNGQYDTIGDINDSITSPDVDSDTGNSFFNDFENNDHGLSGIITAPISLIQKLTEGNCSTIEISIMGKNLDMPCGSTLFGREDIQSFVTSFNIIVGGLICYGAVRGIWKTIEDLKNPDESKVEVMDL